MSKPRSELQAILEGIEGVRKVYFQPPPSVKLVYPCIVYSKNYINVNRADNMPYRLEDSYTITVIDSDPDTDIPRKLLFALPLCRPDRDFVANNLNHYTHTLYF